VENSHVSDSKNQFSRMPQTVKKQILANIKRQIKAQAKAQINTQIKLSTNEILSEINEILNKY
jgi:formate dehydrogenase maturation protein FdhE